MFDGAPRHQLHPVEEGCGAFPSVSLDQSDDDVGAPGGASATLVEHGEGLPDTGSGSQVHTQHARGVGSSSIRSACPIRRQVELQHVHAGVAEDAERPGLGVVIHEVEHVVEVQVPFQRHPRGLEAALAIEICGSSPDPDACTASTGTSTSGDSRLVRRSASIRSATVAR